MNVLIFVMTMLMLLSLMTYARLDMYRNSQVFQLFFNHYMEQDERGYLNVSMEQSYIATKGASKDKKEETPPASPAKKVDDKEKAESKVAGTPRISLSLLFDQKKRQNSPKEWTQAQALLKNLMKVLYEDQPFFKKMQEEHPNFLDELMNSLTLTIDGLPAEKKLKNATDLSGLSLPDKKLDEVFYKMLHGAPYKELVEKGKGTNKKEMSPIQEEVQIDDDKGENGLEGEAKEYKSPKGYYSLLDFVNTAPSQRIRVYLAQREVLEAVFHDKTIVDEIIAQRKAFFNQANSGGDPKELGEMFKNQFEQRRDPNIDPAHLDFTVTKTNPKTYE